MCLTKRNKHAAKFKNISGNIYKDKDFEQMDYKIVKLTKKQVHEKLREHIMLGDHSDGIPNFKSPDDAFVSGTRQTSIRKSDLERWVKETKPENFCDSTMLRGYRRNQKLIDLDFIPQEIQNAIVEAWDKPFSESRKKLWDYFVKYKLATLADHLGEF